MIILNQENQGILDLFNLENTDVMSLECENVNNTMNITVVLNPDYLPCPDCGYDTPVILQYVKKRIRHSILEDRACYLIYMARRYRCPVCGRTYYEFNPFVFKNQKISAKTVFNILEELKEDTATFTSVARHFHVSPTTAAHIFDAHVSMPRKQLTELINIDECYAFKSDDSKYVCMLLDNTSQAPIDILPSRRLKDLESYFMAIPREERMKVKLVCSDMYDGYRSAVQKCLPAAVCATDHFHLQKEINKQVDDIRIRVMKSARARKDTDTYYLLKKFNWMIFKSEETEEQLKKKQRQLKRKKERGEKYDEDEALSLFDVNRKKKYNGHFKQYLNYYDIREKIRAADRELKVAWELKDECVDFYNLANKDTAPVLLEELIRKFRSSDIKEMQEFGKTLNRWRKEIINSFTVVGINYEVDPENGGLSVRERKMNNALIENRNKILKVLKNNANGYRNWTRFRNRAMYVLDKEATYLLNPIEVEKKKK